MAKKIEVVDDAHVEISPDYGYSLHFERDTASRTRIIKDAAEELLEKVQQLRGMSGRIVYSKRYDCSSCGYGFERDFETGRTACCDEEIEA